VHTDTPVETEELAFEPERSRLPGGDIDSFQAAVGVAGAESDASGRNQRRLRLSAVHAHEANQVSATSRGALSVAVRAVLCGLRAPLRRSIQGAGPGPGLGLSSR